MGLTWRKRLGVEPTPARANLLILRGCHEVVPSRTRKLADLVARLIWSEDSHPERLLRLSRWYRRWRTNRRADRLTEGWR
jgi:hypothetical protein